MMNEHCGPRGVREQTQAMSTRPIVSRYIVYQEQEHEFAVRESGDRRH